MNGLLSHEKNMKHDWRDHPRHYEARSPTHANWSRVAIACGIVAASLFGLFYLDSAATPKPESLQPFLAHDPYAGYGIDTDGGDADSAQRLPKLVSSNAEPDSATIDPATGQLPLRKAIVISSYKDQNVSWVDELERISKGWEIYRYVSDAPDSDLLQVKNPNGREALPYLTFLTDNYANLPDIIIFTHGHSQSWHQPEPLVDKIIALNITAVQQEDYINLRCQQSHGCLEDDMFYIAKPDPADQRGGKFIKLIWEELLEPELGPIAPVMGRPCCAQFATTRQAVQSHSLRFWNSLRKPLEERHEGMEGWRGRPDYDVGLKFEMFWHVLFGKDPIHCPPRELCENVFFSGAIKCNDDGETLRSHAHWDEVGDDYLCVNTLRNDDL